MRAEAIRTLHVGQPKAPRHVAWGAYLSTRSLGPLQAPRLTLFVLIALLAGCAVPSRGGWQGKDAEPFDCARAACVQVAETEGNHRAAPESAFEQCMQTMGWRRDSC